MRYLVLLVVVVLAACAGAPDDETPAQALARLELPALALDEEERASIEEELQYSDAFKSLFNYGNGRHTAWVHEFLEDGEWADGPGRGGITSYPHAASIEWVATQAYSLCEGRKQEGSTCYVIWLDGWVSD